MMFFSANHRCGWLFVNCMLCTFSKHAQSLRFLGLSNRVTLNDLMPKIGFSTCVLHENCSFILDPKNVSIFVGGGFNCFNPVEHVLRYLRDCVFILCLLLIFGISKIFTTSARCRIPRVERRCGA